MRKVIVGAFVSLDGVMQAPGGPQEDPSGGFRFGGWVAPYADEVFGEEIDRLFGQPFDLLLGRRTYEIFAAHWPWQQDGPDASIATIFNAATKYVASRAGITLDWANSVALRDAASELARLKQTDGPALITQGSTVLLQTLFAHGLVDELKLFRFPLILGHGKRLFSAQARPAAFRLVASRASPKGVLIENYLREGDVETGDFTTQPPSAAEIARRAKLAREA